MRHTVRMRHIILSPVTWLALTTFFPNYPINGSIKKINIIEHKLYVCIFLQLVCKIFLILKESERGIIINAST